MPEYRENELCYEDYRALREALRQAKKAAAIGDVPIGCVIVCGDRNHAPCVPERLCRRVYSGLRWDA